MRHQIYVVSLDDELNEVATELEQFEETPQKDGEPAAQTLGARVLELILAGAGDVRARPIP